jgi:hypothetical protein
MEQGAAASELHDYAARLGEVAKYDAWLLAVAEPAQQLDATKVTIVQDEAGGAWDAMSGCVAEGPELSRDKGAAFVFSRGGSLQKVFSGPGRAAEVIAELGSRR